MSKYDVLFESVTLRNGVELKNRFALAPMLAFDADEKANVTDEGVAYIERRNNVGDLLIAGAHAISVHGLAGNGQIGIFDDNQIEGLKRYASAMKKKGHKAIAQLHHPGRESTYSYQLFGKVYGPSAIDFPFLNYPITELSEEEVWDVVKEYGEATRRAVEAGYDGVEIHGANHYLIQQFFSAYSNVREDYWGGSFEKRMNFALEVVKEVKRVASELANESFIVGYRISPEEVHGDTVGYTIDDALELIDKVVDAGVDYLHVSLFGPESYKLVASKGNQTEAMNALIHKKIAGRCPHIVVGSINTPEIALDALNYGDVLALGVASLADPDFSEKINTERFDEINMDVTGRQDDLHIPHKLVLVYGMEGNPLPPVTGIESFTVK
ncbi:hypothetical protein G7059_04050 [Erysipelothrix sp. HDW6A]|uniref:oxidoreductase n=1 Tax=Erysipelothrix sp. HDW6A TaxID=2714928 RepID=UPI00140B9BC6|nr:hypothetical protein [Erysipelothrix sp. HDW6A]QIK57077.1 hypothetical protein G7059_04050 [Erysipelothrix sp. HDW6A]